MSLTFWDSNLFIYLIEEVQPFVQQVEQIVYTMRQERHQLITSALTVCETLVKPVQEQRQDLIEKYQVLFQQINIVPIEPTLAPTFAMVRSERAIKTPDALQLSCALKAGAEHFITNDNRLSLFSRPNLTVFSLQSYCEKFCQNNGD